METIVQLYIWIMLGAVAVVAGFFAVAIVLSLAVVVAPLAVPCLIMGAFWVMTSG